MKFICMNCGKSPEPIESNDNWNAFDTKCEYCGGEFTLDIGAKDFSPTINAVNNIEDEKKEDKNIIQGVSDLSNKVANYLATTETTENNEEDSNNKNKNEINKDVLSIHKLLKYNEERIGDGEECRKEMKETLLDLKRERSKMTVKELTEYFKALTRYYELNVDIQFRSYQLIIKTEFAKQVLAGGSREETGLNNVSDKARIRKVSKLLKDSFI